MSSQLAFQKKLVSLSTPPLEKKAAMTREVGILVVAVVIFTALAVFAPSFLTPENLFNVARQISLLGIVAVGMTYIFVVGELDLSVGSLYGFLAAIMAVMSINLGISPWISMLTVIVLGMVAGFINGTIVTKFGIPSFIVTLGGLSIYRGATLVTTEGMPISGLQDSGFSSITSGYFYGIPAQFIWLIAIAVVAQVLLSRTTFGYNTYAVGGNASASRAAGISVTKTKIMSFMLIGALVGVTSSLSVGWLQGTTPLVGTNFELQVIAAVIIGGTNLFGGAGTVHGTLLGAAIMGMITNGLVLLGIPSYVEPIVFGSVIILAAGIDVVMQRRRPA